MRKFLSVTLATCFLFTATACAVDLGDGIVHVPPALKPIETAIFNPTEKSELNRKGFVAAFRATKTGLSDEEFNQKYKAFYNYMPKAYSQEYSVDAFEVQQSDGNSIFYVLQGKELYRIDPFATDTGATYNGFFQFSVSDLNADGYAEILVSYFYSGERINMSDVYAIDTHSGLGLKFDGYFNKPVFFQKTQNGVGLYEGAEADFSYYATKLISEVTKNTRKYVFHKKKFSVQADDYKADVEIEEGTINFPIVAEDLPLQFISRVKMTWLGEGFGYTNSNGYLDGAFTDYFNGKHTLKCKPWGVDDAITEFHIPNGAKIECEYYMYRVEALDCLGDYAATVSYRFSEEKPITEKVFTIIEI